MPEDKNKKGRLLALQRYLYQYTDEQHPVTTQELIDAMEKFGYSANRKTIKDDIDTLGRFDIDIITNISRGNSFFVGNRHFEVPELKLLVDAVSSSRFISAGKSEVLIDKISSMASNYQKDQIAPRIFISERIKMDNQQLYYIIDSLIAAIRMKKKVRFQYTDYNANKQRILKNDGEIYINSPYGCLWNDDFYYLLGYSEKYEKVITFRVDRIVDLEIMEVDATPEPDGFVIADYANKVIEMFEGDEKEVELICDNELMKSVIDKFGEGIMTERMSDKQFRVTVTVSASKTFYAWCFRFAGQMQILGPKDVRAKYLEMAKKILNK